MVARLVRSPNCHARRKHPEVNYPVKYPGAPLVGVGVAEAEKEKHQAYINNGHNRVLINATRRANYGKKLKKAQADPDSPEAAFINGERDRVTKINHEKYWGAATPEGVKELEAAAKLDPIGPAAKKLEAAAAFRKSERQRKKARGPREAQRARERLEELKAAAGLAKALKAAGKDVPKDVEAQAKKLRDQHKNDADEQREIRKKARILRAVKSKPIIWQKIVPQLLIHPEMGNAPIQRLAGTNVDKETMRRIRGFCGVRGPRAKAA